MSPLQVMLIVVEAVTASIFLPPMAWLLAKTYRKSAASRRLVWITAFAMLLGLPLLALVAPSLAVIALPAPAPIPAATPIPAPAAVAVAADSAPGGFTWLSLIPIAAAVWLAGLVKLGAQHLYALVRLELTRRKATPWRMATPIPVRGCDLLISEDCPGPMTWGVLRPVIMLPDEAVDWPAAKLATVLRHELAHVRRRDGLAQALAVIACALYWPNPLVWGAARALRREAELAADDAVIAAGVLPSDYAGQLLELAAEWRERRLTPTGLAMAAPPALSQRVQSILSTDAIRTGATTMDALKLVLLGGAATAALTLARPSVAEVPAPPSAVDAGRASQPIELQPAKPAEAQPKPSTSQHIELRPASPAGETKSVRHRDQVYQFTLGHGDDQASASASASADSDFRLAQQDVQAAPAPPAVQLRPLPEGPPAPPAAPQPGAVPAPPRPGNPTAAWTMTWIPGPNGPASPPAAFVGGRLTPEQRADLDRKLAAIGPAIDKAIKDAKIDEAVQKALAAQDAKTREEVTRQLQQIGPRIQQAIAQAQLRMRFAELQPQFAAARKQAQERQAEAEDRVAAQLEEQAKRARERAQRAREQLNQPQSAEPPQPPKN